MKTIKVVFGSAIMVIAIIAVFAIRLTHIDMTGTRLLVEFWRIWALIVVAILGAGILIGTSADKT